MAAKAKALRLLTPTAKSMELLRAASSRLQLEVVWVWERERDCRVDLVVAVAVAERVENW